MISTRKKVWYLGENFTFEEDKQEEVKKCIRCQKRVVVDDEKSLCAECVEEDLFERVKKALNENHNLTALKIAEVFDIPRSKVYQWVDEGRLNFKGEGGYYNIRKRR